MRLGLLVVTVVIALGLGGYWFSAWWSAKSFVDAIEKSDSDAFTDVVDLKAVSESVAGQVQAAVKDYSALAFRDATETYAPQMMMASLAAWSHDPFLHSKVVGQGFAAFDSYSIRLDNGDSWLLRRAGLGWKVVGRQMLPENAFRYAISLLLYRYPSTEPRIAWNDVYLTAGQLNLRLTDSADVTEAVLDPVIRGIVYVRGAAGKASGDAGIWFYDFASLRSRLLLVSSAALKPEESTENPSALAFTSDGQHLYFSVEAWATSGAILDLDMVTGNHRFVTDGNGLYIVKGGPFKDSIVTSKHRYYEGGGSYDHLFLVTPDGTIAASSGRDEDPTPDSFFVKEIELGQVTQEMRDNVTRKLAAPAGAAQPMVVSELPTPGRAAQDKAAMAALLGDSIEKPCYRDGATIVIRGRAEAKPLAGQAGLVRYLITPETPLCVTSKRGAETEVDVLQVEGLPPPLGVRIELTGRLTTDHDEAAYAVSNAISVTSGRKLAQ